MPPQGLMMIAQSDPGGFWREPIVVALVTVGFSVGFSAVAWTIRRGFARQDRLVAEAAERADAERAKFADQLDAFGRKLVETDRAMLEHMAREDVSNAEQNARISAAAEVGERVSAELHDLRADVRAQIGTVHRRLDDVLAGHPEARPSSYRREMRTD